MPRSRSDQSTWTDLLDPAVEMLRDAKDRLGVAFEYSLGGGSMLMRRYRHRVSRDLDVFVRDVSVVRALSPQLNDFTATRFPDYEESASAIKFILGDQEIDVIVAPALTETPCIRRRIGGHLLPVEEPREIIAKKLLYRARFFRHRDVFDLAVVGNRAPDQLAQLSKIVGLRALDDVATRLREIEPEFDREIARYVQPLPAGKRYMEGALTIAERLVATWIDELGREDGNR